MGAWISQLIQQYIYGIGGEDLKDLIALLGGVLLTGYMIFYTVKAIIRKA